MAAPSLIQTNFTTGELAPEARGRVDIAKYQNAAETLKNVIVQVLGGAKGRGGFRFIAETKDSTKRSRLIPFIFSRAQAYMLEFGDSYFRVYTMDGEQVADPVTPASPYEVVSPYTEAMLLAMDYVQGADTTFLAHEEVPLYRLRRFGHADWRMDQVPFQQVPADEIGFRPEADLTLSSAAVADGVTATASAATFLAADIGREIHSGGGIALIVDVTSTTVATVNVTSAFSGTSISQGDWRITGTPQAPCTPSNDGPVGSLCVLTLGAVSVAGGSKSIEEFKQPQLINLWGASYYTNIVLKVTAHGYSAGQRVIIAGMTPAGYNGTYSIKSVTADFITLNSTKRHGAATVLGTVALDSAAGVGGWRNSDVGSYVRINGGIVRINSVSDSVIATGEILKELSATSQAFVDGWTLEAPVWNDSDGFPRTVTLHAQRLAAAGSPGYPQSIWFSEIGNTLNLLGDTTEDSGFTYDMSSREVNPIAFLPSNRILMALTYGGEFTLTGGQERPINATNPQIDQHSTYGCALVRPILIGNQLFFVQRDGKVLRAAAYQFESNSYVANDVSKLSKHLMTPGIVCMAYQQSNNCLWQVREDGKLNSVTIDSEENVIAWTWHDTEGEFESVACIPGADGSDRVWVIVKRDIDGTEKRFVEMLDETTYTDCCVTGINGTPITTWSGFDHLEGMTVKVLADGVYVGEKTVTSGDIVLDEAASSIEAGLYFVPTVKLLTPEMFGPMGTAQGKPMRVVEANAYVYETAGVHINGTAVETRQLDTDDMLDNPAPSITGYLKIPTLGWGRGTATTLIEKQIPGPFHLLAVVRKFEVNQ